MARDMEFHVLARLLREGRILDRLSTGVTVLGMAFGLLQLLFVAQIPFGFSVAAWLVALGLVQKYLALRVAFDARLFAWLSSDADSLEERICAVDRTLQCLGLQSVKQAGRSWTKRQQGALRLLRAQGLTLAAQCLPITILIYRHSWP
jgi:hypothetical protein